MKLLFISDIHGSKYYAEKAIEVYQKEKADAIILLGDVLYHGARNPLPLEYSPKDVFTILNEYADRIIAIRGNCDSEVDEMVLEFPIMSTYSSVFYEGRRIFLSHGHVYGPQNLPKLSPGDIFAYGHTHIPVAEKKEDIYLLNPGSITLPKENNSNSYGILEGNHFKVMDFNGNVIRQIEFED